MLDLSSKVVVFLFFLIIMHAFWRYCCWYVAYMNCLTMCKQCHLYSQLYGIWFYSVFVLLILLDDFYIVVCTDWLYKFPPICSYVSRVVYHLVAFFRMNNCWLYYFSIIGTCVPSVVSCRYAFFLLLVYYTCNYKIAI